MASIALCLAHILKQTKSIVIKSIKPTLMVKLLFNFIFFTRTLATLLVTLFIIIKKYLIYMLASATKLIPSFLILTATHASSTFGIIILVESLFLGPMLKDSVKTLLPFDYLPSSHVMTSQILFVLVPSIDIII